MFSVPPIAGSQLKHEAITGFIPDDEPYKASKAAVEHLAPGDLSTATLVVVSTDAYLKDVKKSAKLDRESAAEAPQPPRDSSC